MTNDRRKRKVARPHRVALPPHPAPKFWNTATEIRVHEEIRRAVSAKYDFEDFHPPPIAIKQTVLEQGLRDDPTLRMSPKIWEVVQEL